MTTPHQRSLIGHRRVIHNFLKKYVWLQLHIIQKFNFIIIAFGLDMRCFVVLEIVGRCMIKSKATTESTLVLCICSLIISVDPINGRHPQKTVAVYAHCHDYINTKTAQHSCQCCNIVCPVIGLGLPIYMYTDYIHVVPMLSTICHVLFGVQFLNGQTTLPRSTENARMTATL